MTQEQFLPTSWVIRGIPSRGAALAKLLQHRQVSREMAIKFRRQCLWIGIWPLSLAARKRVALLTDLERRFGPDL